MTTKFKVVIPARYGSTRLPGKPLISLAGKPMVAHVCDRANEAGAEQIVVATDDQRIFDLVADLEIDVVMTSNTHQSGTERIAEVAQIYNWNNDDIVVNLQGDEPLLSPTYIRLVAAALSGESQAKVATLAAEINNIDEVFNSNVVKVILDKQGFALYFSRAPIPWDRAGFTDNKQTSNIKMYLRHIGLYAYSVKFLNQYVSWQKSPLETIEALEQLRILWHGDAIDVQIVPEIPVAGVDTEDDVIRIEKLLTKLN
jgi:3-deoxy-manno-octulosonate cytidylyltransferase (CMP-KDO synthetase)